MRVILTHEQSDFDAVASLFGAYLLDDAAVPVLPRRMNRNVRAFITLYGAELPFVDQRDLSPEAIQSITLVDTQSMISLKGMNKKSLVHVIDHHPLKEDLPDNWSVTIAGTGANTTIFIESLRERDVMLGMIPATLLLLGIYEDTGSLTYSRTTSRDLQAASYLLEQGANLSVAAGFLNHPLSKNQQAFYNQIRKNSEVHNIHGHNVIIACGDAREMDEELSTVAHKLRDLLDPDALFVLVNTRGGIQMIARSTSDNIDVAEIASHFGGGGHERAAAGLIKDRDIKDIRGNLIKILPDHIQPAVTVAQIMSPDPHILTPETPVEDAANRMLRYGYEGFPVVRNGKVVGLLTRRAVDRALGHKLNLTIASLMEAGEHTVQPGDSIEHLQRLMTETGWGQIPVVDLEKGKIIGIVTRTDLLKTLNSQHKFPSKKSLAAQLDQALPVERKALLKAVSNEVRNLNAALYIVGGFVRDLMLDRPSVDFDLVVEGDAIALARILVDRYGGRVTSHGRFGTAKWVIKEIRSTLVHNLAEYLKVQGSGVVSLDCRRLPEFLDLVTARTEFYTYPTALPTVERGSIKLDLHRRDFTINTLALRLDGVHYGELHDYWGGLTDLRNGVVRVLHSLSFVDDPTRILRAVRFEQRFGFRIESRTLDLLVEAIPLLDRVSGDRIRHEINVILTEENVIHMFERLDELGLIKAIHPELSWDDWLKDRMRFSLEVVPDPGWKFNRNEMQSLHRDCIYALLVIRLSLENAQSVINRLKLSAGLMKIVMDASRLWRDIPTLANALPSQIVARLDGLPSKSIYSVYLACDQDNLKKKLYSFITEWKDVLPTIDGNELRRQGVPPGPVYRDILKRLRDAWLDGEVSNVDEENRVLKEFLLR